MCVRTVPVSRRPWRPALREEPRNPPQCRDLWAWLKRSPPRHCGPRPQRRHRLPTISRDLYQDRGVYKRRIGMKDEVAGCGEQTSGLTMRCSICHYHRFVLTICSTPVTCFKPTIFLCATPLPCPVYPWHDPGLLFSSQGIMDLVSDT
jgi:hypothetical protein